ncbi:aspartate carbamoyltransferase regulatory subunit [Neisseria sp. Ec49-e6-T10]|uniref:aspartate carbamoyltransferase regulatory subunit n=1 Tax=Neisseria sp. Ec49-e6-T10 TaxID=3140744 RepID=UPI003EBF4ED7
MSEQKILVEAIKDGTVIDHIPAGHGLTILRLFKLGQLGHRVTVGFNLSSHNNVGKDLIKVENIHFSDEQANKLALLAPKATVNVIENYTVVKKHQLELPDSIESVFSCPNSNCASHTEPVNSFFYVKKRNSETKLKCKYCEKAFSQDIMTESQT